MQTERKQRQFWVNNDGAVSQQIGYECQANPGYWWVPALGFSGMEGFCLFEKKEDAKAATIVQLEKQIDSLKTKLKALETPWAEQMVEQPEDPDFSDPCPECGAELRDAPGVGVKCPK